MAKKPHTTITHPHYACSIGAAYTVSAIPGAVPVINCGPGCVDQQYFTMSFCNGFQGSVGAGGDIPGTNSGENEIVFGGAKKLDGVIKSALKIMKGDLFVVLSGCSPQLVGDDVASVIKPYREKGYPIVHAEVPGFKGNNLWGHEEVVIAVIDQFVGEYKGRRRKKLINLWMGAPYFNTFWRGDTIEIKRILEGAGFEVNVLFGSESAGVSEWKDIPKAAFNLVLSPWLGLRTAKHLEKKYGQPYLHIPVLPIGEEATTAFIRQVVEFAGIDNTKAEKFIEKEAKRYYYFFDHFADFFAEYWFGFPSQFAIVGDAAYNIAITKFLSDQIGLIPVGQIISDNTPVKYREDVAALYTELSEGVYGNVEFLEDGYLIEKKLSEYDFGTGTPLILGSSWEQDVADELGAILVEVGTIATEEVVLNRTYLGYNGALSLLEKIYSKAVGG
ncbi:nitrogenase component 1 [Ruminococcus sp. XPD3002]|uniref:nitrogenase component 1 n=1 Tax=Ruminococcus sp. XPD3002 TaxID=1452269 RepID=UPI00091B65A5|nr:nitrogenase molybdenum-iron protein beta chain [Ruminococcus flavefaciens]